MSGDNPRVLIFIDTQIIGGPGRGLFLLLRHLQKRGVDVHLSNVRYQLPRSTEFIDFAAEQQIPLHLLEQRRTFDFSLVRQARRLMREYSCNIFESHGYKGHVIGLFLKRFFGVRWIAVSHGWTTEDWKVRLYHALDYLTLPCADLAITVSPQLQEAVSSLRIGKRTEMVLNAVDVDAIAGDKGGSALRKELAIPEGATVLGCFGRLSSEKGQAVLLEAFDRALQWRPDVHLVLTGDGPDEDALRKFTIDRGIGDRVHFQGYQQTMRDYFEMIDLYVLPSLSEGLPNVVLEAMALSKPVLATEVGAIRRVISDGDNGWIVRPRDPEALGAKLVQLLKDKQHLKAVGEKARESLFPTFSSERRADVMVDLYRWTLQRGHNLREPETHGIEAA